MDRRRVPLCLSSKASVLRPTLLYVRLRLWSAAACCRFELPKVNSLQHLALGARGSRLGKSASKLAHSKMRHPYVKRLPARFARLIES